jgi:hypothetical protein
VSGFASWGLGPTLNPKTSYASTPTPTQYHRIGPNGAGPRGQTRDSTMVLGGVGVGMGRVLNFALPLTFLSLMWRVGR